MDVTDCEDLSLTLILLVIQRKRLQILKLKNRKKRNYRTRIWRQFIYTENERELNGFFSKLFMYMQNENEVEFMKATRMKVSSFKLLLNLVKERLHKLNVVRESIPAECRLELTLVYMSQGVPRQMLAWSFRVGVSTVALIIYETCDALWEELRCIYMSVAHDSEWRRISSAFEINAGLPHVLGAIDGKHIRIKCPPHSGTQYFNYKKNLRSSPSD